jgi:transposase
MARKATKRRSTKRNQYPDSLKRKVVAAVKKGMTHKEASKAFKVGVHSVPNWVRRYL